MKKVLAILLATTMIFSLAACGSGSSAGGGETTTAAATEASGSEVEYADDVQTITISMAHLWNSGTMYEQVYKDYFNYLEKQLGGKYKFDVTYYAVGTLLGAADIYQGVVDGTVDMGACSPSNSMDTLVALNMINMPRCAYTDSAASNTRVAQEFVEYFDLDEKECEGVQLLACFGTPNFYIYSNDPIYTPDDVKGMDVRTNSVWAVALGDCGANPVAMPMSEIVDSAQKGIIKGAMSQISDYNQDLNLSQVFTYATRIGFLAANAMVVVMNDDFYATLPDDVKAVIDDSHWYLACLAGAIWDYFADEIRAQADADEGFTLIDDLTEEQKQAWLDATAGEEEEYIETCNKAGLDGQELYDKLTELCDKYVGLDYNAYVPGEEYEPNIIKID